MTNQSKEEGSFSGGAPTKAEALKALAFMEDIWDMAPDLPYAKKIRAFISAAPDVAPTCAKCSSADLKDTPHLDGKFCRDCGFVTPTTALTDEELRAKAEQWHDHETLGDDTCEHRTLEVHAFMAGYRLAAREGRALSSQSEPLRWPEGAVFTDLEGGFYDENAEPLGNSSQSEAR